MAKHISTEEESNLKRQARRRLIGAVALVLAIVIFLPMVFDDEPSPTTANDIELRIPDKDKVAPLVPQAASAPVAETVAVSAVSAAPVAEPVVSPVVVSAVSAEPVAPAPKMEAKPKVEAKPKAEAKPKVEAKPTPKTGWVVQVGAYSNADAAKQMNAKLGKEGFHVYTEKAGNMVRVRVGSYPTREAADKIKAKLEKLGLHPNVVNLE
ncbi:MAG: SPOR domain-containing protein [Gallionella sp.]|nr:SPOR domain-containing protein [Gallionella sp.]